MAIPIKIKRGNGTPSSPLASAELAFDLDTNRLMIGDGTNNYQLAKSGLSNSFQTPIIDVQVDASLNPGAAPAKGDRYLLINAGSLHANFGSITGVANNDIVEYNGTAFVVVMDASVIGEGILIYTKNLFGNKQFLYYDGTSWGSVVSLQEAYDGGGAMVDINSGGGGVVLTNAADTLAEDGILNVINSGTGDTGESALNISNTNDSFGKPLLNLVQSDDAGSGVHLRLSELNQNPTAVNDGDIWRVSNSGNSLLRFSTDGVVANAKDILAGYSGSTTLVAGTSTVSNSTVTANTRIFLTHQNNSGAPGFVTVSSRSAGVSFTITSSSASDTSNIAWVMIEP